MSIVSIRMRQSDKTFTSFPLTIQGTSNGSDFSISAIAATKAFRSGEPGAYVFYKRYLYGVHMPNYALTMGSFSIAGTLNVASCGLDMVVGWYVNGLRKESRPQRISDQNMIRLDNLKGSGYRSGFVWTTFRTRTGVS